MPPGRSGRDYPGRLLRQRFGAAACVGEVTQSMHRRACQKGAELRSDAREGELLRSPLENHAQLAVDFPSTPMW